jgi:hypothetical protein
MDAMRSRGCLCRAKTVLMVRPGALRSALVLIRLVYLSVALRGSKRCIRV